MDAVKSFNAELSSLYEVRPPISKAKMTAITRGAIKAIKFYKHVVQSVEKFILKCKPEYKVPGLYVIDSIVRQSRHQFGPEKDVFAPRFAKNMQQTFVNLYKCPPEDKSKVIRVLNLWQKNQVFAPEAIQPLFDLADPNHPIYKEINAQNNGAGNTSGTSLPKGSPALQKTPTKGTQPGVSDAGNISHHGSNAPGTFDQATLAQLQQLHKLLYQQASGGKVDGQPVHFDRKLLDFDYDDDEDDDPTNPSPKVASNTIDPVGTLLSNPEVLKQLQTLQNSIMQHGHQEIDLEKLRKLHEMKQQEEEFDKHLAQTVPNLPFAAECDFKPNTNSPVTILPGYFMAPGTDMSLPPPGYKGGQQAYQTQDDGAVGSEVEFVGGNDNDVEVITLDHGDSRSQSPRDDRYNRRRRSRSRSRDRRRSRRSRSRSRSRSRRHRSRSRERDRDKDRDREKEREKDKERKKRGLPPIKKDHLSVCSTTLWVGHLSKLVHQEDLSDTFGEFGGIISIDLIIPRGCAFIVMDRRQDAAKCLTKLKNYKLHGKALTLAWAPGKGVKGKDLKDYWEGDLGVSYIPFQKVKPDMDIELLEDGGVIDEETMPQWLKNKTSQKQPEANNDSTVNITANLSSISSTTVDTSQPPPVPGGLLPAPPLALSLVPPFQLNRTLLGAVGMNLPPGSFPNLPIGVPPPNLAGALMQNQLLGLGSPFSQAPPPALLQTPVPNMSVPGNDNNSRDSSNDNNNGLLPIPPQFAMMQQHNLSGNHDDNMDVEMEDADKSDRQALSDQLLASMNTFTAGAEVNLSAAVNRFSRHDEMDDRRDRRGGDRGRNRSRDRDRDRSNRDRDGRRGASDDRNRDRDGSRGDRRSGSGGGGGGGGDRRGDRGNRWGDRDDNNRERDDRREREKRLNDRLREMAGGGGMNEGFAVNREPPSNMYPPPADYNGDNMPPIANPEPLDMDMDPRFMPGPPIDDFDRPPRMHRPVPPDVYGPDFDPRIDRPDFDDHPMDVPGPMHHDMMDDRYMRRDRFPDDMPPIMDDYDRFPPPRNNGPPPDFFPPPRDGFGPRGGPMMRGPRGPDGFGPRGGPPDGFGPRGPPMMGPRGPMFHPRGPHMRGPRPGPWMDGGGMRPGFGPRFDGPPGGFRGPPGGHFDDHHQRHPRGRHDDRHEARFEGPENRFEDGGPPRFEGPENRFEPPEGGPRFEGPRNKPEPEIEKPAENADRTERRSRWGNSSPAREETIVINVPEEADVTSNFTTTESNLEERDVEKKEDCQISQDCEERGNTTPLHDEAPNAGVGSGGGGEEPPVVPEELSEPPQEGETAAE